MTKDELIEMARQAGFDPHDMSSDFTCNLDNIEAFAKLVAQPEQEPVAWEQFYPDIGKPQIAINPETVGYVAPQRTWVGLDWLPKHRCGLHLSHNEHRDVYETVEEFYDVDSFISMEELAKAISEDSVWVLHWYPETPIGFHRIAASTLEAIEAKLKQKNG